MKWHEEKGKIKYIITRKRQIEKGTEKKKLFKMKFKYRSSEINRGIKRMCTTINILKTIITYIVVLLRIFLLSETMTTE